MHVILVSKDMLPARDLPVYGNRQRSMPHLGRLAAGGTVFGNCVSPCPSSAMTYSCVMVGRQPYELSAENLESQREVHHPASIFAAFAARGCHTAVVWDKYWTLKGRHHALRIYDRGTVFHDLDIYHEIGIHRHGQGKAPRVPSAAAPPPLEQIRQALQQVRQLGSDTFTWLHCPHILAGHSAIGADLEYFDEVLGLVLEQYDREGIFLFSDHGHMDFHAGELLYGKTMHHQVLQVPLITPRLADLGPVCHRPFSSMRLKELLLERRPVFDPFLYSVNQLPHQPNRVLTIVEGPFKYWYFKKYRAEALFDLEFDPREERNLLLEQVYSRAKKRSIAMHQAIAYGRWEEAGEAYRRLRGERQRVWAEPGFLTNAAGAAKNLVRDGVWNSLRDRFFPRTRQAGRWGSTAASQHCLF